MIAVPNINNKYIEALIEQLKLECKPLKVICKSEAEFEENFCFPNVERKKKKDGGSIIYGWQLWEHSFMIEAEFHSIWKSNKGEYIDVTPKNDNTQEIIFLEDKTRKYEGKQVDNCRIKTRENKLIDDFIILSETKYWILNKEERANSNQIDLTIKDYEIYKYINSLMVSINQMLIDGKSRNSLCFCDNKEEYKKCHGKDLNSLLKRLK